MIKTEFYDNAVQMGFYGVDRSGLYGKKDNVRKYWEDMTIKISLQPVIEQLIKRNGKFSVIDLGCGGGEGVELLTHIPIQKTIHPSKRAFLISKDNIDLYKGVDISSTMVEQARKNYSDHINIQFVQSDLAEGLPCRSDPPFDLYFSSYCSLSHLTYAEMEQLTHQIFTHVGDCGYMVFDLHGRYSLEWPVYWDRNCHAQYGYNMGYLLPPSEQHPDKIEWFDVTYWSGEELIHLIKKVASKSNRHVRILTIKDRSILVGRHMDTDFFKMNRYPYRVQVNRLFDRDYRGQSDSLKVDPEILKALKTFNQTAWSRISDYCRQWQIIVDFLHMLMTSDKPKTTKLLNEQSGLLVEELKMLAWLQRNAVRFPTEDFWASIMGPQIACVLRNLEFNLPPGIGCGHSLFCLVEIR